jgi:hypothetical protein
MVAQHTRGTPLNLDHGFAWIWGLDIACDRKNDHATAVFVAGIIGKMGTSHPYSMLSKIPDTARFASLAERSGPPRPSRSARTEGIIPRR